MYRIIHADTDNPNRTPARMALHSPVGALSSAKVCRKLARYTAILHNSDQMHAYYLHLMPPVFIKIKTLNPTVLSKRTTLINHTMSV